MIDVQLLDQVVSELEKRPGKVKLVAKLAGVDYHSVRRIMTRKTADPGFLKVVALAKVLGLLAPPQPNT